MKINRNILKKSLLVTLASSLLLGASAAYADDKDNKSYTLKGTCAFLPAARATEFHGNPDRSKLNLGMAGNQWVVFDSAMRAFNLSQGNDPTQPAYRENNADGFTLADLKDDRANRYFIELIPPGQIRKQIKTGCLTLGNDEDRNFLPGNFQVKFDVFASTNYNLMQDLANNGFIDEAVPYIRNRLDLLVKVGNPQGIGEVPVGSTAFDKQFDIIMDLLSADVIASSLDHINEGIHNAANGYMKKVHAYIKKNNRPVTMTQQYNYADGTYEVANTTLDATVWIQRALNAVATPLAGSPSAIRLLNRDAGENHASHDLADNGCGVPDNYTFCEYAILNKANTHESRVHHVETPNGVVIDVPTDGYVPVHVGFVWITELAYQINNTAVGEVPAVTGMNGVSLSTLGIPNDTFVNGDGDTVGVNGDKIYSLALLATSENEKKGRQFINFLRGPEGQAAYVVGGFTGLKNPDAGKCYAKPVPTVIGQDDAGNDIIADRSVATNRTGPDSCPDWLGNGSF